MNDWVGDKRTGKNLAKNDSCKEGSSADDTGNNLEEVRDIERDWYHNRKRTNSEDKFY